MFPDRTFRVGRRPASAAVRARVLLFAALVALIGAACGGTAAASFDPTGPCRVDGRVAGAYPQLEALIPKTFDGAPPKTLDSGRNCSAANLGTLASHGVTEVRFAGGVWPDGPNSGLTLAVFQAPGLQADWIGELFEASARSARTTGNIKISKPSVGGVTAHRMDLVNGESAQTVIAWAATTDSSQGSASATPTGVVHVLIAADEPESRIQQGLTAVP
jgi:hypothetical protein